MNPAGVPTPAKGVCSGPDCGRPVVAGARSGLCAGHSKQAQRGRALTPLAPRGQTPWQRIEAACLAYADAETDEAFRRAKGRLRQAVRAFMDAVDEARDNEVRDEGEA